MDVTLNAKKRDPKVKAKALRKEGWVPGCVYGKGIDSMQIQIPYTQLWKALKDHAHKLELQVEGGSKYLVGIEEVQKGALGDKLDHISFHALNKNEKAVLTIEIHLTGKAAGEKEGGMINHMIHEIDVKGYPQDIPDSIEIDITGLGIGEIVHISDIAKNYKFEFSEEDMDKVLVKCAHAKVLDLGEVQASESAEQLPESDQAVAEAETTLEEQVEEKKAA